MFIKRFLLVLGMSSILLTSLTISSFAIQASPLIRKTTASLYQQYSGWTGSAKVSNTYRRDCFKRYYKFDQKKDSAVDQKDAANYFIQMS